MSRTINSTDASDAASPASPFAAQSGSTQLAKSNLSGRTKLARIFRFLGTPADKSSKSQRVSWADAGSSDLPAAKLTHCHAANGTSGCRFVGVRSGQNRKIERDSGRVSLDLPQPTLPPGIGADWEIPPSQRAMRGSNAAASPVLEARS